MDVAQRPVFHRIAMAQMCVTFDHDHGVRASQFLWNYLTKLIEQRRHDDPESNLVSALANAEIDGKGVARNPVAAAEWLSKAALKGMLKPIFEEKVVDLIVAESERLTRLVNQVLDMAKIESGHGEWRNDEIDLRALVAPLAGRRGHSGLVPGRLRHDPALFPALVDDLGPAP